MATMTDSQAELERVIGRMKEIQRAIAADGQPMSTLELDELEALGRRYAEIVDDLKRHARGEGPDADR